MRVSDEVDRMLAEMWDKIKEFRESVPVADAEDQPALTYYDGIRAGLAWAESLITGEMNKRAESP